MSFRNVSNYKATIEQATRRYITNNQERETEGTFMKKRVNKWTSRRYKREEESLTVKRPRSVHTTFKGPPGGPFVLIDAALDNVDIANLQILGDAVHTNMQHINFASNRPLYGSSAEAGGGNNVTFITGFLQVRSSSCQLILLILLVPVLYRVFTGLYYCTSTTYWLIYVWI